MNMGFNFGSGLRSYFCNTDVATAVLESALKQTGVADALSSRVLCVGRTRLIELRNVSEPSRTSRRRWHVSPL